MITLGEEGQDHLWTRGSGSLRDEAILNQFVRLECDFDEIDDWL